MSLSRSQVRGLRSAGWTVVEEGPLVKLRRAVLRLVVGRRRRLGRLQPVVPVVHVPVPRWPR